MTASRVVLGRVNGLFGVKGWLKIYSYTRPAENIFDYKRWELGNTAEGRQDDWRPFRVVEARRQGKTWIAHLADAGGTPLADRDAAIALLDAEIAVPRADLPPPEPGHYYWSDLVGLDVINRDAVVLGRVSAMMETGANDVLVVAGGERRRLIPFVPDVIVDTVDLEAGRIVVDWEADF